MSEVTVHHGDSRDVLKGIADNSIDSCACDPPYALVSIGKRFGKEGSAPAKVGKTGAYARASSGFMGQKWDTGETAFDPDFWREVLRVLKPGAHVVAFSGTRTVHRMTTAIEAAGFEVRDRLTEIVCSDTHVQGLLDSLDDAQRAAFVRVMEESQFGGQLAWCFGSGFPKSHNVSKGIDKANGSVREIVGEKRAGIGRNSRAGGELVGAACDESAKRVPITSAGSPEAAKWEGWGSALKPALEPIVLARKPLSEKTVAANVIKWGTGALNIDGCRIPTPDDLNGGAYAMTPRERHDGDESWRFKNGRAGEASADRRYADAGSTNFAATPGPRGGSASGRWPANVVHDGSDEVVAAFPEAAAGKSGGISTGALGRLNDDAWQPHDMPRTGHDDSGGSAARFFYSAKADAEDRLGSKHPTVKPIDLMRWLCRLVTPPGGVILDPFAGTGTTGLAAYLEGFDAILIEREEKYVADIHRRLAWVKGDGRLTAQEMSRAESKTVDDLPLFGGEAA